MKSVNTVLLLEAGGPCAVSCIKLIRSCHPDIKIVAADMSPLAIGLQMADIALTLPAVSDLHFSSILQSIIDKYKIDLVFPCFEFGFDKLSTIPGPFVTDFESAIRCKDKYRFFHYCQFKTIPHPETWLLREVEKINSPVYVKPRFGVGSRNNFSVINNDEFLRLKNYLSLSGDEYIVQELLTGKHWNVDVMVHNSVFKIAVPRMDLLQKAGNCITVEIKRYQPLMDFAHEVHEKLNIKSPFNLEVFEPESGKFVINEINVRFGGGIIFSALAGANFISYLIDGQDSKLSSFREGLYTRYYEETVIDIGKVKQA